MVGSGLCWAAYTLLGRGSRLIGGTITTTLTIDDVNSVLMDGFFPVVPRDAMPARQRRVGLQEIGLPYAADAAVTRHLARFLSRQAQGGANQAEIRRGPSGLACPDSEAWPTLHFPPMTSA